MNINLKNYSELSDEKVSYILSFIFSRYRCGISELTVVYGHPPNDFLNFPESEVLFIKSNPLSDYTSTIELLYKDSSVNIIVDDNIHLEYDVIDLIFSVLNETSSWMKIKLDVHNRISPNESFNYMKPVLDQVIDEIMRALCVKLGVDYNYVKPSGTCSVSHDIDNISAFGSFIEFARSVKRIVFSGSFSFRVKSSFIYLIDFLRGRDPYYNFDFICDEVESLGLTSSYYFMVGGDTRFDGRYSLTEYSELLRTLKDRGHNVGLHPSYNCSYIEDGLVNELASFNQVSGYECKDVRHHYLRFDSATIAQELNRSQVETDTSLGFASRLGFRNGTCHPFKRWDIDKNEPTKTLFIPLAFMDTTALGYLSLNSDAAIDQLNNIITQVHTYKGHLDLLWHNSNMYYYNGVDEKKLFRRSLKLMTTHLTPCSIREL